MAAAFEWKVAQLERNFEDGGVIVAHWRAHAYDGYYAAFSYGTAGFTPDPSADGFVPYESLTESQVLAWVWADGVDKDATEAALQAKIDADMGPPTVVTGTPW